MDIINIDAISEEESRKCLQHEEELVVGTVTPLLLFNPSYEHWYALTTSAEESKRYYYSHNVVLPQNQHRVNEEATDTINEKEAVERQFEASARSDDERQNSEENKQKAQKNKPRELEQTRSTAEQEKRKKRCADNNQAKVSSKNSQKQTGHRGTLRYELKESFDQTPSQSEEKWENTKEKEAESSKGTPCYSSFLTVLGSCLWYTYTNSSFYRPKNRTMG
jgi:hypothetical protein